MFGSNQTIAISTIKNYKMVFLGESAVGKTSIVLRFSKKGFSEFQESTIGAAFQAKEIQVDDTKIRYEIWDTAGQERYHSLAPMYYRGAKSCAIVYDITSESTFARAKKWVEEIKESGMQNCVIMLVGNKTDLESSRKIPKDIAMRYAQENDLLFLETSAKKDKNIDEMFIELGRKLIKNDEDEVIFNAGRIQIENDPKIAVKSKKCCR